MNELSFPIELQRVLSDLEQAVVHICQRRGVVYFRVLGATPGDAATLEAIDHIKVRFFHLGIACNYVPTSRSQGLLTCESIQQLPLWSDALDGDALDGVYKALRKGGT